MSCRSLYRKSCTVQAGNSHIVVPALSLGALRSWEAIWASGLFGLVEELVWGYGPD